MQEASRKDNSYLGYQFEVKSLGNVYANEVSGENLSNLGRHVFEDTAPPNDESFSHTAATTKQEIFCDASASRKKEEGKDKIKGRPSHFYRNECAFRFHNDNALSASQIQRNNKPNCVNERLNNTSDSEFPSTDVTMRKMQQNKNEKIPREHDICTHPKRLEEKNVGGSHRCRKECTRIPAFLLVLTFFMAAVGLILMIMLLNGEIRCPLNYSKDAPAPEKLVYFSSELRELKENFTKLKEELDYTRQELARLREGSNHLTEGKARNITTQANHSSDRENVKLMLNSSEQRLMEVISNVWVQVNKTERELRKETTKLQMAENSSQEEIQRIKRRLTDLRQEGNSREKRINETIHLKLKNNDAMMALKMLLNSSFQEMKDELSQIWSSLHSSEKDLQAMWIAINTTEQELTLKITNFSRLTGPNKALGSNRKGGLRGCKYQVQIGNATKGTNVVDVSLEEPMGSRIIGATCSTNYAQEYNLESNISSANRRRFICNCKGTSNNFAPVAGKEKRECKLHYWLCSMI
ncbi:PREDICTED: uncharacterized protein LOC107346298 isoform X1 [Acropora digitifera]|uniref:uncharacterized protein LOC107346298 isoform X1 n=1 Tax=Acropora digitifera TaxID=70779 RepID=UPI00077A4BA0|nr:PREDICTED: uncharacterized protein LOC107346298 isoform X1 [Acropora digitifera]